jgi:hypothetical protein
MKRNALMFVLAAALAAAGTRARAQAPAANGQSAAPAGDAAAQKKAEQNKSWENGVKAGCSGEIAAGGVCAGKDFSTGLKKCLHENRKKLSDGCNAAIYPHKKGAPSRKAAAASATPAK